MSFNKNAIVVRNLSKMYRVPGRRRRFWSRSVSKEFLALDSVSLEVSPGELVGVIGRNGAGKSTLLKVLTRITPPTSGEADLYGRVGSLLEVGTGFHPELTGRENIFLNGSILGMRRAEIVSQFDAIVSFAGVERFLDTPVKRYSSGMYVRLAFAVAAHLKSEILLVDEVLAVGDIEFQRHCIGKIKDVAGSGRTVLFVSHHLESISALCQRALVLDNGKIAYDGSVSGAVESYMNSFLRAGSDILDFNRRSGSGEVRVAAAGMDKSLYQSAETKVLTVTLNAIERVDYPVYVSVHLVDVGGAIVVQCDSRLVGKWFVVTECLELAICLKSPWLKPGSYSVDIFVCAFGILDRCERACVFEVSPALPYPVAASPDAIAHGAVFSDFSYQEID